MGNTLSCCCKNSGKYKPISNNKVKLSNGHAQIVNGVGNEIPGPVPDMNETVTSEVLSVDEADRREDPVQSHWNQVPLLNIAKSPPIRKYVQSDQPLEHYYNMNHKRRGMALIFNHETFEINSPRKGTNSDRDRLKHTLASLDFDVNVYENRTISEIKNILLNVAKLDHSENDCLMVVFLTHGEMVPLIQKKTDRFTILTHDLVSYLYAQDNKYTLHTIWECFTDEQCPTLKNKPRIFLIQACQGDRIDYGHYMPRTPSAEHLQEPLSVFLMEKTTRSLIRAPGRDNFNSMKSRKYVPFDEIQLDPKKNLPQKDFLVVYSTMPGYYSYRDVKFGTWYIEALCNVLNEKCDQLDLLNMLTVVNQQVAINYESDNKSETKKQMPCVVSMLTKLVLFSKKNVHAHSNGH